MIQLVVVAACLVSLFAVLSALVWTQKRARRQFEEAWPALDDEEFLRRCPPGTNREVALRVRQIIAKNSGVARERIYPEQHFARDLNVL